MELKTIGRKVKCLFDGGEDRGVSPVIGVILMVAITVILAAVIGAFVLGLGDDLGGDSGPQAQLSMSEGSYDKEIDISHRGGEVVDFGEITVLVEGSADSSATFAPAGEIETGESSTLTITDGTVSAGDNVKIELRHDPSSSIIATGTVKLGSGTAPA